MTEDKRAYLQMLQEPICRMSTISAIFKCRFVNDVLHIGERKKYRFG